MSFYLVHRVFLPFAPDALFFSFPFLFCLDVHTDHVPSSFLLFLFFSCPLFFYLLLFNPYDVPLLSSIGELHDTNRLLRKKNRCSECIGVKWTDDTTVCLLSIHILRTDDGLRRNAQRRASPLYREKAHQSTLAWWIEKGGQTAA